MTRAKYPGGLGRRGRRLWGAVCSAREESPLGPGEEVLLEEACRLADRLDRLDAVTRGDRWLELVEDEGGRVEVVVSGALTEARLTVAQLRGALISLGLDAPRVKAAEPKRKGEPAEPVEQAKGDPLDDLEQRRAHRAAGA